MLLKTGIGTEFIQFVTGVLLAFSIFVFQIYFMKLLLLTILLLGIAFAGIAIKIWAKKDGTFSGTCASQNANFNEDGEPCGFCGKMPEDCENK